MKVCKIISMIERWIWQPKKLPYLYGMKVKFNDNGDVIIAEGNVGLVTLMRQSAFSTNNTNKEYMLSYAARAVISNNEDIRATSEDEFIEDLIKLNHIEII